MGFRVQLTSVTADRIEGRWERYPLDSQTNPQTCEKSGERFWEDVAWIRDKHYSSDYTEDTKG